MSTGTTPRRSHPANSAPLSLELRFRLAVLVEQVGEPEARRIVGLSRGAFARSLAGLGVYPGTVALVRVALDAWFAPIPDSARGPL